MSINTMALLGLLKDKSVKITMNDGTSFICEPLQIVLDQELESFSVYIIEGLTKYKSDTYTDVYTPDIGMIELLADSYGSTPASAGRGKQERLLNRQPNAKNLPQLRRGR